MPAARAATGIGPIGAVGPVLAVLLAALGMLLLHEALAVVGALPGRGWLPPAVDFLDGFAPRWWLIPDGLAAIVLGGWLIVTALRPGSHRSVPVRSSTGIFLQPRDLARLASDAATGVTGVLTAASVATRRTVTVTVLLGATGSADEIRSAVEQRLEPLAVPPTIRVQVRRPATEQEGP